MGYCVRMDIGGVEIPADKIKECLEAINGLPEKHKTKGFGWVSYPEGGFRSLGDALHGWRFEYRVIEGEGSVEVSYFSGEEWSGDEECLFDALGPFVSEGAIIECIGEDGEKWRYLFEGGNCRHQTAVITWEDN